MPGFNRILAGFGAFDLKADRRSLLWQWVCGLVVVCAWIPQLTAASFEYSLDPKAGKEHEITSPDGELAASIKLTDQGKLVYKLKSEGKTAQDILTWSPLGYQFKDLPDFATPWRVEVSKTVRFQDTWEQPWGEQRVIKNHYHGLQVKVTEASDDQNPRHFIVVFRLYDDALAFRYQIPVQEGFPESYGVTRELTGFEFTEDLQTLWIPNDWDTYENLYQKTPLSQIATTVVETDHIHAGDQEKDQGVNTPVTLRSENGLHLSIHEAALLDYPGMTLIPDPTNPLRLQASLVPWPDGTKVKVEGELQSPWRLLLVGRNAGELLDSRTLLNLNEPAPQTKAQRTIFSKPQSMTYAGVWWSMHLGLETWKKEGRRHGATTYKVKEMIDFAARNNLGGVLVEGWNTGWESWYADDNFDFTTPYTDFDLEQVVAYGRSKGVEIIGHHETGGQIASYEKRLEEAFALYHKVGIRFVKTGYAGKIRPNVHSHHGQWMVRHYQKVVETAARYGISLIVHEPIKPTGLRRTWPNLASAEGVRGMEWNAWSAGNPPSHHVNLVFTRLLAGPMDYTPGVFERTLERFGSDRVLWNELGGIEQRGKIQTTLAKQLAMYVVFYSPVQMVVDLPANLKGQPGMEFIQSVATDWEVSRTLQAEMGEYVVTARKERGSDRWFIGGMTDAAPREVEFDLSFLDPGVEYEVRYFVDGTDASFENPKNHLDIYTKVHTSQDRLKLSMASGGGFALSLVPKKP